jgi:hypothetical protein
MSDDIFDYEVKCRTCYKKFTIQLFESHQKNLFMVDKKDWYCDKCKKAYLDRQTAELTESQKESGFCELEGTAKRIAWAVKIRKELINKVNYLKSSLKFETENEKMVSDQAFDIFIKQWQALKDAKWWIDHRNMNVRDISLKIKEISQTIEEK